MTQSRTRQRDKTQSTNQESEKEGGVMTTDTTEKPEVNTDFPKTFGDMTFQTPAELAEYAAGLDKKLKEIKPVVKATKPGRPVSQKKQISEMVAKFLNDNMSDELRVAIAKVEGDFILRLTLNNGVFTLPISAPRAEGSGGNRGGRVINVDGQDYPSAKNARDTLHPDTKGRSQNYETIVKYLEGQKHIVVTSAAS